MTELSFIENELKKFNVTDAAIAQLSEQYMPLVINGIDDKAGQKVVKEARSVVKRYRIDVDKRRKELNADALEFQRRINGEAKRITAQLEPIETHLANEEKKVDDELERIKREKEIAETTRYKSRVAKLNDLQFKFDGSKFYAEYEPSLEAYVLNLKQWDDTQFNEFVDNSMYHFDYFVKKEIQRKKNEDEERKAMAAERARLDAVAKEQAEKDAALKAEADRLAYLKSKEAVMQPCPPTCEAPIHINESKIVVPKYTSDHPNISKPTIQEMIDAIPLSNETKEHRKEVVFEAEYCAGFDAAIDMVLNSLDNQESNDIAKMSVWDFIEHFKEHIIYEAELYKTDG